LQFDTAQNLAREYRMAPTDTVTMMRFIARVASRVLGNYGLAEDIEKEIAKGAFDEDQTSIKEEISETSTPQLMNTKICSQCAEEVKSAAVMCRSCKYYF
jgi:ribosomal protein L40E